MLRKRIFETIDILREDLDMILQENMMLKNALKETEEKNNKYLLEIKKCQSYIKELRMNIQNIQRIAFLDPSKEENILTKIKMGCDWWVEGDDFVEINLYKKFFFMNAINSCRLSLNEKFIGVVSGNACFLIDIEGNELYFLNDKTENIENICFSNIKKNLTSEELKTTLMFCQDSRYVFSSHGNKSIIKWDIAQKKPARKWINESELVLMKSNDHKCYFIEKNNRLKIYDIKNEQETIINIGTKGLPTAMAISPNNKYVFIGMSDKTLIILKMENQERYEIPVLKGFKSIDISSDDINLLLISTDDTINIYEIYYDKIELQQIHGPFKTRGKITGSSFFADSRYIITSGSDLCSKIWDLRSQRSLIINGYHSNITSLNMGKKYFCSGSGDGKLNLWHYDFN